MSEQETVTISLELTEQQFDDLLSAINTGEVKLSGWGEPKRADALTEVWAQVYRGGMDTFRQPDPEE